jgi:iron complex outermembrane recepter protein
MPSLRNIPGGVACLLLFAHSATATEASSALSDSSSSAKVEDTSAESLNEIVVSATKRDENLNRVPISIAALSTQAMEESQVKSISDIASLVPGIEFDSVSNWGPNLTNIAIRGVSSLSGASTTGIYINDTPIQSRVQFSSYTGQPLPFTFDLARVEVDRGPQGTLFGAGAEGGAVRFIPTEPSLTQSSGIAHAEVSETKWGGLSYETGMAAGGPLVDDSLAGRVSVWYRKDGGYVDRVDPFTGATVDADANRADSKAARLALVYRPTDTLSITSSLNYQSHDTHDTGTFFEGLSNPQDGVFNNGRLLRQPTTDTFYLPSIKVEADLEFADLTAISSYFHREASTVLDATNLDGALLGGYGNPLGPAYPTSYSQANPGYQTMQNSALSQEVRLASHDANAPLTWLAGLFYSRVRQVDIQSVDDTYFSTVNPILYTDQGILDTQVAAFGQVDYRVTQQFKLTAGLRVADVKYQAFQYVGGPFNAGVPPFVVGASRETPVTPKAGVSYQLNDNHLLYVSVAKGYRVGGINTPLAEYCAPAVAPKSYSSDSLWSYEIGAKDTFLDGRLQVDSSAFHINWKNIQQSVLLSNCGFIYFANEGSANSNGFDLALTALLGDHFRPGLAVSYTDAHYAQTLFNGAATVVNKGDSVGTVPQVPTPWNLTGSLDYKLNVVGDWKATLRLEDIFHSRNNGRFASYDPTAISYAPDIPPNPSTNLLNGRATAQYGNFELEAFVKNALNSTPVLNRGQDTITSNLFYASTLTPRTVGVGGSWHF